MTNLSLADLGWSAHFLSQLDPEDAADPPVARIAEVARDRLFALAPGGATMLIPPSDETTGDFAVGDWVVAHGPRVTRRLERRTLLERRAAGTGRERQLIAANVDTLGVVTSANADFNIARLERYVALAAGAGCLPLIILTKADLAEDVEAMCRAAQRISPLVATVALDARTDAAAELLAPWCRGGQTLALVGSSGVGKTTLSNALTGEAAATQGIREDDAKGRHTTTARALRRTRTGGWLIDTPGMRALRLTDAAEGIETVFEEIERTAEACRFSDCTHESEPGCAVQAGIAEGRIDAGRLARWQKLRREDARNSATLAETRARERQFSRMVRGVMAEKRRRRDD